MGFDVLAPHYRWMESVLAGSKLHRCRTAFLNSIPSPRRALLVGEGNGRFLVDFVRAHPACRVTCVDASAAMLAHARNRLSASGAKAEAVEFVCADLCEWLPPEKQFDLVVTHFFLDCFRPDQLEEIVPRLAAAAAPHAHWLLADFCEPAGGFAKWRARLILHAMYLFFRCITRLSAKNLTPPDALLVRCGFTLRERRVAEWGLLHSDLWVRNEIAPH
ncbi:MAG: class I SAM-dependent methyltransferase [Verrucomicrobia bacterium]|nr:class I SAM-dependent methyltransferase [Verrucomicrobiota bacterium]